MLAGPLLLGALGLTFGLVPDWAEPLVAPATAAVLGRAAQIDLYLFKEVNAAFLLSLATFAMGLVLYRLHGMLRDRLSHVPARFDPGWDRLMALVADGASGLTGLIQTGRLRRYVFVTFAALAAILAAALIRAQLVIGAPDFADLRVKHWAVLVFILAGALITTVTRSRMTAVAALGVIGIGVALVFIMFGAPDVAITQLLVEVLQVVLVAVAMLKLPHLDQRQIGALPASATSTLALALGAMVTGGAARGHGGAARHGG